jgi:hypothetical protein
MSAMTDTPLGGFEQRLLTQLKAEVAARPIAASPVAAPSRSRTARARRASRSVWRLPTAATAAVAALTVAVLSALPAAAPSLAQAFPILSDSTHTLPVRFVQALRAQWRSGAAPRFDLNHAYAFSTVAGTGYVVVDRRSRWLCILVPGFSAGANGRCERVSLARLGDPRLSLRIGGRGRQEIVALLPRGARANRETSRGHISRLALRRGVLAITSRNPVTVMTTIGGHTTSTTYRP